jgi:ubiquinone/menaquinone biosynthesis C-methylase UbiE
MHDKMDRVKDMTQKEHIAVHLVEGSELHLPIATDSFDGVVMVSVLEHLHQPLQALKEIRRITKKGGRIMLSFPIKNPITHFLLKVTYYLWPSAKLEEEHVSSHADIIKAADSFFGPRALKKFRSCLPLDYGGYCICSLTRRTERWP